jgi:hypothetical protein
MRILLPAFVILCVRPVAANSDPKLQTPRIDSVIMSRPQPHASDPAVIWYDDFDGQAKPYAESEGGLDNQEAFGDDGRSMLGLYEKGQQGRGNRKVFFGDSPTGKVVQKGKHFSDIYWRIYVKHQPGWTGGGPDKLSRATSIVSANWAQAMIAHVWSSGEALTLDPASGVLGDQIVTTRYNDFSNLHWLGSKPASMFNLHSPDEVGRWVCVESRAKLNTPGKHDGLHELWIDGRLEAERKSLDWRGSYNRHGINAVFLETYWNKGSPVTQRRWIDNFVISTKPIGPVICPCNPILIKTLYHGSGKLQSWKVEIAADETGKTVVWRSKVLTDPRRVKVGMDTGQFLGPLKGRQRLTAATTYYFRVMQENDSGEKSTWSPWHQPIKTEDEAK